MKSAFAAFAILSCLAWAGVAAASCDCVMIVESEEFRVHCYETCGRADTSDTEIDWMRLSACHLRAMRFAIQLSERLRHDPGLRAMALRSRLDFGRVYGWGDTLGREDWNAPADLKPATMDSLLAVFREIDFDTSAILYTVQLGAFGERRRALELLRRLDDLRPAEYGERDPGLRDTTLRVDWRQSTCVDVVRPDLFIIPVGSGSGPWRVGFGLFIDRRDAERTAQRLQRDQGVSGALRALPFGRELVEAAVGQWRHRGITDEN